MKPRNTIPSPGDLPDPGIELESPVLQADSLPTELSGSQGWEEMRDGKDLYMRDPGEGKGYPLQYSALENSMDCIAHGVTKSQR